LQCQKAFPWEVATCHTWSRWDSKTVKNNLYDKKSHPTPENIKININRRATTTFMCTQTEVRSLDIKSLIQSKNEVCCALLQTSFTMFLYFNGVMWCQKWRKVVSYARLM
jgi:hypothetical protein